MTNEAVVAQPTAREIAACTANPPECTSDDGACNYARIRISPENCYFFDPGNKVYLDNTHPEHSHRIQAEICQYGTSGVLAPEARIIFPYPEAPASGSGPIGCTQFLSHVFQDHNVDYTYHILSAKFIPEACPGCPGPGPGPAPGPGHHHLSDAECRQTDLPPNLPASGHGVYMLQKANDNNACLSYADPGDPEDVPINNCVVEQKKMFSLLPAGNGCYFIRNGNVTVPPITGRCLHVENEDAKDVRARGCDQTDQQHWKLYKNQNTGAYNLINQQSGKCLDRDSGGDSNSHVIDCNGSEWQWWKLRFIREN